MRALLEWLGLIEDEPTYIVNGVECAGIEDAIVMSDGGVIKEK